MTTSCIYTYYDTSEFSKAPSGAEYLEQGIALLNQVLKLIKPRSGRNIFQSKVLINQRNFLTFNKIS